MRDSAVADLIPTVIGFDPIRGHPGCAVVINGAGFSPVRADNHVTIGGAAALVVQASDTALTAISDSNATTGRVEVEVDGRSGLAPVDFEVLPYTGYTRDRGDDGPPILFTGRGDGVQQGAPTTKTSRVLVALCHPSDLVPSNGTVIRNAVVAKLEQVHAYYDRVSYRSLNLIYDVTANWHALDGTKADLISGDNFKDEGDSLNDMAAQAAQHGVPDYHAEQMTPQEAVAEALLGKVV